MSIYRTKATERAQTFSGLSADDKPTTFEPEVGEGVSTLPVPDLSSFYEFDTGKTYIYSVLNTNPLTSNNWWEV